MKLFSKKRLQIVKTSDSTTIRWCKLSFFDMLLIPFLGIQMIWGVGSYLQMDEIIGLQVLPLNSLVFIFFWVIALLFLLHLLFNRKVKLKITKENLYFSSRLFYKRQLKLNDILKLTIFEKTENFAELPPDGRNLARYELHLFTKNNGIIKIKGLSKKNDEEIKSIIGFYKK